ncbi:MAG TPA: hypothetical protein GYA08_07815 [Chloroflexi bacterium]|nr:hypothetical protein [Chloroflexota bacterium]
MSDTVVNLHDEIPEEFASLVEAGEFWDTHDSGAYEDTMTPIDIELDVLDHKLYVAVARDVAVQLQAKARDQGVGTETLVNMWLLEKLLQHGTNG